LRLLKLIINIEDIIISDEIKNNNLEIIGLTADSIEVRNNYLFAAFAGLKYNGNDFIDDAIKNGAKVILIAIDSNIDLSAYKDVIFIKVKNPRRAFSKIAANFFERQVEFIAAVTGTNGKSSIVNFCRQIWQSMEHSAACLGTLGITSKGINRQGSLTTPDPVTLHSEITELEASGVTHLAIEASSQGLDQYRLDGVNIKAVGFTNITRDHLDYHGSMEEYLGAKLRIFEEVIIGGSTAILNIDIEAFDKISNICKRRNIKIIDFGKKAKDIKLVNSRASSTGQIIELNLFSERYKLNIPLIGEFQIYNVLCALGIVISENPDNIALQMQAVSSLEKLQAVRGRLELADKLKNGAGIYVDYAHNPDGLETMLKAIRPHVSKKLHVIIGCGGDRDRENRAIMGEVAMRCADVVIITDDNPRTENPDKIRKEIMLGAKGGIEIAGRRNAIFEAIKNLKEGDILVVAGKGHEQGQIIGKDILPFDDVTEIKKAVLEAVK